MSAETQKVDVLLAFDNAATHFHRQRMPYSSEEMRLARAAVAELIEASREYIDAEDQWSDDEEPETSEAARSRNAHVRRWKRVDAALARIGGAA